ncbi:mRNA interferase MazF [Curtobacterium sp. 9128]|uniref:type II toxin-antitoxin system PemK/MazF family toxin n=1 Tax=Curtobacterium sp. 9128 TaxID=1793722 RepID=UPI0007D71E60|nr:type II toxin-antitoxin system PemK/MazF family toxin [Curtobacterium sp. 9128]SBN61698.1 mRNA interferase MazF [Curtobacterium sp. 9128]
MVIERGDVVWADFGSPGGSEPAKVRPCVVLQADWLMASKIQTVLTVPLTSNTAMERFPGNVLVPSGASGLDKDSVANVTQVGPVSREFVDPHPVGMLPAYLLGQVEAGVRLALSL